MRTSNTVNANKINENTKANIIAFAIMAVILTAGIIYGMQLESIGY